MSIPRGIRPVTWEDALKLRDGERYEVINGELRERVSSFLASTIAARIAAGLLAWSGSGRHGTVAGADGGYTIFRWSPGDVRMPDASSLRGGCREFLCVPGRTWLPNWQLRWCARMTISST